IGKLEKSEVSESIRRCLLPAIRQSNSTNHQGIIRARTLSFKSFVRNIRALAAIFFAKRRGLARSPPAPNSLRHLTWRHRLFFSSIRTIGWLRNARPWGFDSLQSGTAMVKCLGFSCFSPDQEYAARKPSLATL